MRYQQQLIGQIFKQNLAQYKQQTEEPLTKHPAIEVYQTNYIENGIRALSIGFPTVAAVLEEGVFRYLARDYLLAHPKQSFDWADYGARFSTYMLSEDALSDMPFLPELAELDWRLMHIERAADIRFDGASFALLQTHNLEQLQFIAAPGAQIMHAIFPLKELYEYIHKNANDNTKWAHTDNDEQLIVDIKKLINDAIKLAKQRSFLLYRKDYKGIFELTNGLEETAFQCVLANNSIAEVLATFKDDEVAMTAWLHACIQSKKIVAVKTN